MEFWLVKLNAEVLVVRSLGLYTKDYRFLFAFFVCP